MLVDTQNEPAESPPLPKWQVGATDFGIFLALLLSCMVIVSSLAGRIARWLLAPEADEQLPLLVMLSENLGMQLGMLAAFLGFFAITRAGDGQMSPAKASPAQSVKIGFKWLAIAYPIMIGANLLWKVGLEAFGFERVIQDPVRLVQEGGTTLEIAFIYLMIVLVAPLCEELVFRGAIFRFLHHRIPLLLAVGLSALFFALIHFNLYSFVPLLVIGVTLALAYRESGSILSAIVFHSAFNTLNLVIILLFPEAQ